MKPGSTSWVAAIRSQVTEATVRAVKDGAKFSGPIYWTRKHMVRVIYSRKK